MRKLSMPTLAVALAAGLWMAGGSTSAADQRSVLIGTGSVTGVYFPTGGAICRLLNKGEAEHGVSCAPELADGSVTNTNALRDGQLDFAIVQSDWQYHAYHGTSKFQNRGLFEKLRAVFSVHPEPFTVVARADAGITTFEDLKGKRVNIGNPGSGQRGTMEVLMEALGWDKSSFAAVSELKAAEQSLALCAGKIDAMVYTVGHPSGSIKEAVFLCDAVLVPVTGPAVDKLVDGNAYYRHATIPGGMYPGTDADTATFGVGATLVSSADVPADVVYQVVRAVFENLEEFKTLHPALAHLKKEQMIKDGLSAPLHEGAVRYYREKGWM